MFCWGMYKRHTREETWTLPEVNTTRAHMIIASATIHMIIPCCSIKPEMSNNCEYKRILYVATFLFSFCSAMDHNNSTFSFFEFWCLPVIPSFVFFRKPTCFLFSVCLFVVFLIAGVRFSHHLRLSRFWVYSHVISNQGPCCYLIYFENFLNSKGFSYTRISYIRYKKKLYF